MHEFAHGWVLLAWHTPVRVGADWGAAAWEEGLKAIDGLAQPPGGTLDQGDNLHIGFLFI